ncbi:MAG: T9SS type A sorting domain-containing protein [Ignavibacteriae bacterium]|nr:T9SS type A sorting domain-containing protein [Ignavibacteriota bacterium]MCB9244172.1 T9SS type A sorting domain-containing protein [Ignavibacteriales bacterium]
MKTIKNYIAIFAILFCAVSAYAQDGEYKWVHPTPQGNTLYDVKMWNANNWYAIGEGGLFMKTTNAGVNWQIKNNLCKRSDGYVSSTLYSMYFFDINTGYVCGEGGKLIKTTNGGNTWDTMTVLNSDEQWHDMYWLNSTTGFLCGGTNVKAARTTDGGVTWTQLGNPPSSINYYGIYAFDANSVICAATNGNVYKTTNAGVNWSTVITGASILLNVNFIDNNTGYLSGSFGTVMWTTNSGNSWTDINAGLPSSSYVDIDFKNISGTDYVFVTGDNTFVYRAVVGTNSWDSIRIRPLTQNVALPYYSTDVSFTGDTLLSVGVGGLINTRYGSNGAFSFTNYVKRASSYDLWAESSDGRVIVVGQTGGVDQVMYSTNGGSNWQAGNYSSVSGQTLLCISMVNSLTGYAAGTSGVVAKTTNGGANWNLTSPTGSGSEIDDIFFLNENTGWVVGWQGNNFKTTNGGSNWTPIAPDSVSGALTCSFVDANTGWIGGYQDLYRTTDGGLSATSFDAGLGTDDVYGIQFLNANTGFLSSQNGRMRRTTDGGISWDTIDVPIAANISRFNFIDRYNGMASGSFGNIFRTRDGGDTWEISNTSGTFSGILSIKMTATNRAFLCGSNNVVFKYIETVTGTPELTFSNTVTEGYFLEQNYPNPFNPSTTIRFGLPTQSLVSLKVYDVTGREVANLIDNEQMNAGVITKNFNAKGLASGIYFYSLITDNNVVSGKKMILIK